MHRWWFLLLIWVIQDHVKWLKSGKDIWSTLSLSADSWFFCPAPQRGWRSMHTLWTWIKSPHSAIFRLNMFVFDSSSVFLMLIEHGLKNRKLHVSQPHSLYPPEINQCRVVYLEWKQEISLINVSSRWNQEEITDSADLISSGWSSWSSNTTDMQLIQPSWRLKCLVWWEMLTQ